MQSIEWSDFERVRICVGTIKAIEEFPQAKQPAWILHIDFGAKFGMRKSSAQITNLYNHDNLIGTQVMAVINFPKKQIGPIMSECLVTGFAREDGAIVLARPDKPVPNGVFLC